MDNESQVEKIEDGEPQTSIGEAMDAAWNDAMGEDTLDVPEEFHNLEGFESDPEPVLETPAEEIPSTPLESADEGPAEVAEVPTEGGIEPPQHWSQADRDLFKSQTPDAQGFLLRRHRDMEADYTRKTQDHAETVRLGKSVSDRIDPEVRARLASSKTTDEQFVTQLVDWHKLSIDNPVYFAQQVLNNLGLKAEQVYGNQGGQQAPQPQPNAGDPQSQRIAALEAHINQEQENRNEQTRANATSQLTAFKEEKDESGALLRPHLEVVKNSMARLMLADPSFDLQRAYETAVFSDPSLRNTIMPAQNPNQRIKEATRAAKVKSSNIRGSGHTIDPRVANEGTKTLMEVMNEAADDLNL